MRAMLRAHLRPASPPLRLAHSRKVGSASRAILMDSLYAVSHAVHFTAQAIPIILLMTVGSITAHSKDWKPPMEPPIMMSI